MPLSIHDLGRPSSGSGDVVHSVAQLAGLRPEWNALSERFASPLLDHDWFLSAAEAFAAADGLEVLTSWRGSKLEAAAPLVRDRSGRLSVLGARELYEPGGWIFASHCALLKLRDRVMALKAPILLQRVSVSSPLWEAFTKLPHSRALVLTREGPPSFSIRVTDSWENYHAEVSRHLRKNLRQARRRAEKQFGTVHTAEVRPGPDEVLGWLEQLGQMELSGWKGRSGSTLLQRPQLLSFFARYGRRAAASGQLRIRCLSFGSRRAAMELALESYEKWWQLKIAYDERLADYSPGIQLTASSIREAFQRRLRSFEFLGLAEDWERKFRPASARYGLLAMYPVSAGGAIALVQDARSVLWRRALTRWRREPDVSGPADAGWAMEAAR